MIQIEIIYLFVALPLPTAFVRNCLHIFGLNICDLADVMAC